MMRRAAVALVVLLVIVPLSAQADSFHLILRPGTQLQSGSIGYSTGSIMAYAGFDLLGVGADFEYTAVETYTDYWEGYDVREEWGSSLSGSATLFMPHLGGRFSVGQGDVRPYVFGSLFKSFAFVNAESDWYERRYIDGVLVYEDEGSDELDDDVEEFMESLLGFWGLNLGVGAEYQMSERFSLGAEFGMRMVFTSATRGETTTDYDDWYDEEWTQQWEEEATGSLRMTYVALVMGFQL